MPLRRYSARCVRSRKSSFGQRDATLPGAFRPCRSYRLRRFAPLRALQGPRLWGPGSARAESAPFGVSPATDPGVHAVFAPAASVRSLDPFRRCYASNHKDREVAGRVFRCVPGHALPFEAFSLDSSRPVVTDGRYLLAVAGRCACRRRGCEPRRRLRWRLPTSRSCSAAEVRVHGSLSPAADAPMLPWASSWRGRVEDALAEATRTNRAEP